MISTSLQNGTRTPPQSLRDALKKHAGNLVMLPEVATEAMNVAQDPCCEISDFSLIVERDVNLTTEMLSIANSTSSGSRRKISSLHDAVVRLGLNQCRSLILSSSVASAMKNLTLSEKEIRDVLWNHSFTTAVACVLLNRTLRIGFHGEEFTAGLLHDFGRTLLSIASPDDFGRADPMEFLEEDALLQHENEILETNHCEFGAWFAQENHLPEELVSAILWHHQPEKVHEHQKLTALVSAADHVANHIQHLDESVPYCPKNNTAIDVLSRIVRPSIRDAFHKDCNSLIFDIVISVTEDSGS